MDDLFRVLLGLLPLLVGFSILPLTRYLSGRLDIRLRQQEARVEAERQQLLESLQSGPERKPRRSRANYFDQLVAVNVESLAAYYGLVRNHANVGFLAAEVAGLAGFALILVGLVNVLLVRDNMGGAISVAVGVLTEFLSAVFFYLHSRTVDQLRSYHASLIEVQNVLLAFRFVESVPDPTTKAELARILIRSLVTTDQRGSSARDVLSVVADAGGSQAIRSS